jgi:probable F420-dependent oxidoreductase
MKFGLALGAVHPARWVDLTEEADRLGFESVWMPEHLVLPLAATGSPFAGSEHPPLPADVPVFDVFTYLGHLSARTRRIKLGTHVYNIGLRHPFVAARAAATLDVLSEGRLLFGIGASWLRAEWDAVGLDFDTRGARVDEAIEVCRRLWTEPVVEHHGTFFDFGPVAFEPKPVRPGGVALHIGGDGPAALRRAAAHGAGWIPMNHRLEDLAPSRARLARWCEQLGRTEPIEITVAGSVATPSGAERFREAGVDRVLVRPWERTRDAVDGMRRFADEVIGPLDEREALP